MKLNKLIYIILITFLHVFFNTTSVAQNKNHLKVGLVLSGGGAKGVAHVGVIKKIEEAGIKIDYIGGTSMGAIVASLYAIGYNADQLDSIIRIINMGELVDSKPIREHQTYFKKTFDNKAFVSLPIHDWKINLPEGLSTGQDVINKFNELTRKYHGHQDFSKFPIPLVIIATDLVNGESVEFHEGNLPLVMRASSSFPTLFKPVKINGRVMVDGGVLNNFPVKQVKEMGADLIIGVSVEDGLYNKEQLNSMNNIMEQISSFQMVKESKKQLKLVDVFLKPNIKDLTFASFDQTTEIINRGVKEAEDNYSKLLQIAKMQKNTTKIECSNFKNKHKYIISDIVSEGSVIYNSSYISKNSNLKKLPAEVSINEINDIIYKLEGTENFDLVTYQLLKDTFKDTYTLKISLQEKQTSFFLKLGMHYDDLYKSRVLVNFTSNNIDSGTSKMILDLIISDMPKYRFLYHKENSKWPGFLTFSDFTKYQVGVATKALGELENYFQGTYINLNYRDWTNLLMGQEAIHDNLLLGIGAEIKHIKLSSTSLRPKSDIDNNDNNKPFIFDNSWFTSPFIEIHTDTKDNEHFPTKGIYLKANLKAIISLSQENNVNKEIKLNHPTTLFNLKFEHTFSVLPSLYWTNTLNTSANFGGKLSSGYSYTFGGYSKNLINNNHSFLGYSLYGIIPYVNDGFIKYLTTVRYKIKPDIFVALHANFLNTSNSDEEWYNFNRVDYYGYAASLSYQSFIGPIEAVLEYNPGTNYFNTNFVFGYWF
ncbi:MAG: patatin-like phospholipase family protein [Ichthyobacteriaceae bacterium]|nr:patatin-like phospholipase family protein [Ichthyobacteriaceae bacterium]